MFVVYFRSIKKARSVVAAIQQCLNISVRSADILLQLTRTRFTVRNVVSAGKMKNAHVFVQKMFS